MSSNLNPGAVTDNLILCVDAGNPKSYPGTGTTWYDISGHGYNLTLNNAPTFANSAFTFNGTNQTAASNPVNVDWSQGGTIDIWVNSSNSAINQGPFSFYTPPTYIDLYMSGGKIRWEAIQHTSSTGFLQYYGNNAIASNTWYNIQCAYTTSGLGTIYINGVADTSNQTGVNVPNGVFSASFILGAYGGYWLGQIAACKVYNRSLSQTEILQNFNATRGRFGI
jgi:hypothetical protein